MPIALSCPCGKNLRVQDNLAGRRVKCPVCGEILEVAPATAQEEEIVFTEISSSPRPVQPATPPVAPAPETPPPEPKLTESQSPESQSPEPKLQSLSIGGKTGSMILGNLLLPSVSGRALLTFANGRVIEDSRKLVGRRHAELFVSNIDSGEIVSAGNPVLLILGLMLLGVYGVGLILLLVFLLKKNRYLVIRSPSNAVVVALIGEEGRYSEFLEAVLAAAEATRAA